MNSIERREGRYQRRRAEREARRRERAELYNFERVAYLESLYQAMKDARRGVFWKASVQRYNMNFLRNILRTAKELQAGVDVRKGFIKFDIIERGKKRHIQSVHFSERVVQRSLCVNALKPQIMPGLICDNGASLENKGIHFALNRLKAHLVRHYRKYGAEGYVVLVDFKGYYPNIQHAHLHELYKKKFGEDQKLVDLTMLFVHAFGEQGLGLGSEKCQIAALYYSSANDHYAKEVLRCKFYGRYMDDSYFICESKERAHEVLAAMTARYEAIGITPHPHKTAIVKLSRGFSFLKTKFSLDPNTGRVILRPSRTSIARQRRKLKKFKKYHDAGEMDMDSIRNAYMSWRGYIKHTKAGLAIKNMDDLYKRLFGVSPLHKVENHKEDKSNGKAD